MFQLGLLKYELRLAMLSFRKNPILTTLMVAAVALGIGVCMTTVSVYYLMSNNPIPHKSERLFAVQLDSWEANNGYGDSDSDYPEQLTWTDAQYLLHNGPEYPRVAMFKTGMVVETDQVEQVPIREIGRVTSRDFFAMFDVPFSFGSVWSQDMEDGAEQVVVLSHDLNEKLFGGSDSTGQQIRLNDELFRIVGVMAAWNPTILFYDVNNGAFDKPEDFYLPISLTAPLEPETYGNTNCWKPWEEEGYSGFLNSECTWLQFWVELPDHTAQDTYKSFLDAYFMQQQELGRYGRPLGTRISDVEAWLDLNQIINSDTKVLVGLAFMFLAVCVFNTVGLLLAKFLGRASDIGVRRALGATRSMIFRQHLIEVAAVGLVGGMLGLGLAWLGLQMVAYLADAPEQLVRLNLELVAIALGLAILATLVAGLYPSWQIGRIPPARYLKV